MMHVVIFLTGQLIIHILAPSGVPEIVFSGALVTALSGVSNFLGGRLILERTTMFRFHESVGGGDV
jgi:hypothetical protein